jgi:NADPH-dependent glutamate synthase beta subunit-like oxidoreductase
MGNLPTLEKALEHILDLEKLKYCFECGICTASCPVAELLPDTYNPRILLHSLPLGDDELLKSAELWLCAWCYRCYRRCPQGLELPEIFQTARRFAVERGYMDGFVKALEVIRKNIPLPASCCYVCFHPERAIGNQKVVTDAIQHAILEYDAEETREKPLVPVHGEKVAVIGSGPAGLSAAHDLAKRGYSVTVFEKSSSAGGLLRRCIPEFRLPKEIVDFDVERIAALGVKIEANVDVGRKLTINQLMHQGFSAVFVATGAHEEMKLGIKGEELRSVLYALDFLENANKKKVELTDQVFVIGGGNVAIDSARDALRFGAKEVTILYRRSRAEMPASPWEIKEAMEEGIKIEFLVAPKRIIGENGRVTAVECIKMELGKPDETGRRCPVPVKGSEFTKPAGTVIVAAGHFPCTVFLPEVVEVTEKRTIAVEPFTLETTSSCIFAGGDAVSGPATLMEAILAGKRAATSIDCYLRGASPETLAVAENVLGA